MSTWLSNLLQSLKVTFNIKYKYFPYNISTLSILQQMQDVQKLSETKRKQLTKKLSSRFHYQNIINEQFYLKSMTPYMKFSIKLLLDDPLFKNIHPSLAIQIIKDIKYFHVDKSQNFVTVQYQQADRVLIVSGVKKEVLKEWVDSWNRERKGAVVKEAKSCIFVQFSSPENAFNAKKYFRSKKTERDAIQSQQQLDKQQIQKSSYKHKSKRVRIVILRQQFFALLFDILNQKANQYFNQAIQSSNTHLNSNQTNNYLYIPLYSSNYFKSDEKYQQIDDAYSSQFQSQTSSAYDPSLRIQDIDVQTSSQGTQMDDGQVMGIGVGVGIGDGKIDQVLEKINDQQVQLGPRNGDQAQETIDNDNDGKGADNIQMKKNEEEDKTKYSKTSQGFIHKNRTQSVHFHQQPKIPKKAHQNTSQSPRILTPTQSSPIKSPTLSLISSPTPTHTPTLSPSLPSTPPLPSVSPQQACYPRYQYLQIKKRLTEYINKKEHNNEGLSKPDIPKFIRRQTQSVIYKQMFRDQVIRKSKLMKIGRSISDVDGDI